MKKIIHQTEKAYFAKWFLGGKHIAWEVGSTSKHSFGTHDFDMNVPLRSLDKAIKRYEDITGVNLSIQELTKIDL